MLALTRRTGERLRITPPQSLQPIWVRVERIDADGAQISIDSPELEAVDAGDHFRIGADIRVYARVTTWGQHVQVRVSVEAPRDVHVLRGELVLRPNQPAKTRD